MYIALKIGNIDWGDDYINDGKLLFEANKKKVQQPLIEFIQNGKIDGSQLQEDWFPQIDAQVFISHASADNKSALALAEYLFYHFGISSFIDSCVWGYADNLLKEIDDVHCWLDKDKTVYSYQKRNGSTSHVHMMLATALSQMMDRAECVIFVESPESITTKESVDKVWSPWIYHELSMMNIIRRKELWEYRETIKEATINLSKSDRLLISYNVDIKHMVEIEASDLREWKSRPPEKYPLDSLYAILAKKI